MKIWRLLLTIVFLSVFVDEARSECQVKEFKTNYSEFGFSKVASGYQEFSTQSDEVLRYRDFGYVASKSVWDSCDIRVCWATDYEKEYSREIRWVVESIEATWERYSAVNFFGWQTCPTDKIHDGFGITISNTGRSEAPLLGIKSQGNIEGVVLNWNPDSIPMKPCSCSDGTKNCLKWEICVRSQAVHEFGHILSLAHEQNRHDKDDSCREGPSGEDGDTHLTPYDPDSAMNYCSPRSNFGKLSYGDVITIRSIYGE